MQNYEFKSRKEYVEQGKEILAKSGLPIISASGMADAAQKAVNAAKGN